MIAVPRSGTSVGFAAGAVLALYPNQLVRSALVECIVILVLGAVGAVLTRRFWTVPSKLAAVAGAVVASFATAVWAFWQSQLGGDDLVSAGLAVWVVAALTPCAVATIRAVVPRRIGIAILGTGLLAGGFIATSGTAAAGVPQSPAQTFVAIDSAERGLRIYEPLSSESVVDRAERAVERLIAGGGLDQKAIVVTLPTGSGWVDGRFVRGAERALDGQVAILAMQYTEMLSWQAYWFNRSAVEDSAKALVDALNHRLPDGAPPLYFYGQSLGALGVEAALKRAEQVGLPVAGSLSAGPPAIAGNRAAIRLVNTSDPVVVWGLELAVRAPRTLSGCVIGGQPTPTPPWAPLASFVQASVDLLLANDNLPGLGHRYDERQGTELFSSTRSCR